MSIWSGFTYSSAGILALAGFAWVTSVTPGPNNLMLLHSGARFGFVRTIPHMLGISSGFVVMVFLCCLGVAQVVLRHPSSEWFLKVVGCAYMLWLAWKLWQNGALPREELATQDAPAATTNARPMTALQAALFQYVNPKAWMMALTLAASYLAHGGSLLLNTLAACGVVALVNFGSITLWAGGGELLRGLVKHPKRAKAIQLLIVTMTVYCALAVWF